jgi:hypothetical protein
VDQVRSKRWEDATRAEKALVVVLVSAQLSLAASAWSDLASRPAAQVNGSKRTWAAVIAINFVGPLLYFWKGRRPDLHVAGTGS